MVLIVIIVLLWIALRTYIGSVFLWGDFIEHYGSLVSKRKKLLNILLGSVVLGLLVNLFVFGITP